MANAEARQITLTDLKRFMAAFDNRIARYKLRHVPTGQLSHLPFGGSHNGLVYADADSRRVFTQIPYHFQENEREKYAMLVGDAGVVFRAQRPSCYALIYACRTVWPELAAVYSFAEAALLHTGNWLSDSLPGATFYSEASAFTL